MSLAAGSKLGPYEIVSALGAGGMGEVYRARDTRLGRDVAIKVLPEQLSGNPGFQERFEREAKAISSLNHPNICTLYDVGRSGGTEYLVLELVEGESLAERLTRGPLPVEQAMAYGIQIAEALEAAHKKGVLHRDLKPGNIMATKSGLKLLDFGLAKPMAAANMASSAMNAMTASQESKPLTAEGTIVGTFQYISPEQLEGHEADARSDIFALGCVLYEMAAGRRAFSGKTQASIVASILASEPSAISSVQPLTPPAFERTVKLCLAKDPEERWQTAHDVKLQLKWVSEGGSQAGVAAPVVAQRKVKQRVAWMAAAGALALATGFAAAFFLQSGNRGQALQASLLPPKDLHFEPTEIALAPDGSRMTFVATAKDGNGSLWVRPLNSLVAQQLAGTDGAHYPFWSPDGKTLGFFAGGKLKKIDASGGPVVALADAESGRGGTWNREGTIIFSPKASGDGLYEVSSAGGVVTEIQQLDKGRGEDEFRWPFFMPDGRHYAFYGLSITSAAGTNANDPVVGLYFAELGKKGKTRLLNVDTAAQYADGYLFYLSQRNLMAQPFDASAGRFKGAAFPVAQRIEYDPDRYIGAFSVSTTGTLEYIAGEEMPSKMLWFDREGKETGRVAVEGSPLNPSLSPSGKEMAVVVMPMEGGNHDVWVYDLARGVGTRVTSEKTDHLGTTWSRDGQRVFYSKSDQAAMDVYSRVSSGLGPEGPVLKSSVRKFANDWSPDGKVLIYMNFVGPGGIPQLWVHEAGTGKKDYPLLNNAFVQVNAQFSPDGRWIAYHSDESGKSEVYAISYPSLSTKVQISSGGGVQPRWRKDGKELFYVSLDGKMMAAPVTEKGTGLDVGAAKALFDSKVYQVILTLHQYDVSGDGQRFLINTRPEVAAEPATIYANWQADFKK